MAPVAALADFHSRREQKKPVWEAMKAGGSIASMVGLGMLSDASKFMGYLNPYYDVETSEAGADALMRHAYVPEDNQYLQAIGGGMDYLENLASPYVERFEQAWPQSIPGQIYESLPRRVQGLLKSGADLAL